MRRLLVCCQLFYPELISTGQSMTELCEQMAEQGVEIEVISGQPTLQDRKKLPDVLYHKGIVVRRVWGTRFPKLNILGKAVNHLTFAWSVWRILRKDQTDRPVLVVTNPPFLPLICALSRRSRFVVKIADLYPDTLVSCNVVLPKSMLVKLWRRANRFVFSKANSIIVLGRCMADRVSEQCLAHERSKIVTIPVWGDDQVLGQPLIGENPFQKEWGLAGKFVVGYSGNMGRFHDLDTLMESAKQLKDREDIVFCIVGNGHQRNWVASQIKEFSLTNVQLHSYVTRDALNALLQAFDVGVVTLLPSQVGLSVPSKTFGVMAAGRAVIAVMPKQAEIARMIEEENCGLQCDSGEFEQFTQHILRLKNDPELCKKMGRNGRQAIDRYYSVVNAAEAYLKVLFPEDVA